MSVTVEPRSVDLVGDRVERIWHELAVVKLALRGLEATGQRQSLDGLVTVAEFAGGLLQNVDRALDELHWLSRCSTSPVANYPAPDDDQVDRK